MPSRECRERVSQATSRAVVGGQESDPELPAGKAAAHFASERGRVAPVAPAATLDSPSSLRVQAHSPLEQLPFTSGAFLDGSARVSSAHPPPQAQRTQPLGSPLPGAPPSVRLEPRVLNATRVRRVRKRHRPLFRRCHDWGGTKGRRLARLGAFLIAMTAIETTSCSCRLHGDSMPWRTFFLLGRSDQ